MTSETSTRAKLQAQYVGAKMAGVSKGYGRRIWGTVEDVYKARNGCWTVVILQASGIREYVTVADVRRSQVANRGGK